MPQSEFLRGRVAICPASLAPAVAVALCRRGECDHRYARPAGAWFLNGAQSGAASPTHARSTATAVRSRRQPGDDTASLPCHSGRSSASPRLRDHATTGAGRPSFQWPVFHSARVSGVVPYEVNYPGVLPHTSPGKGPYRGPQPCPSVRLGPSPSQSLAAKR